MTTHEKTTTYDAVKAAETTWPGWTFHLAALNGDAEEIHPEHQVIVLDPREWPEGIEFGCCHALVHLDWEHVHDDAPAFTDEQQALADWVAGVRLGLVSDSPV